MASSTADVGGRRRVRLAVVVAAVIVAAVVVVVAARLIRASDAGIAFLAAYPGTSALPAGAPVGFPLWVAVCHALGALTLLLIFRSGWQVHGRIRPSAFWTRRNTGRLRTAGAPVRLGLPTFRHLVVNGVWVATGVVFVVLLFSTGQWERIVPTRWDVVPNAVSAGLQYASLGWPSEDGWLNYNALQVLAYFVTTFVAAPLAIVTGVRLTPGLAGWWQRRHVGSDRWARRIHYPVMLYFAAFTVVHVFLVLATGAIRNLNHLYALRDDTSWAGAAVFAGTVVVMAAAWFAGPRIGLALAERTGTVRRR